MAARLEMLKEQFFDDDGNVLSGGKLNTYTVGTTTAKATYTTATGDVAQANPVVLGADGRIPSDLYGVGYYKIVITDSDDGAIDTIPSVCGINTTSLTTIGDYSGDLDAAVTAIGATETALYIDSAATMSANTTVPVTTSIKVLKGGSINQSTYTLTLNGPIEAGPYEVFTGTGTVAINEGGDIWADWFGSTKNKATLTDMMSMLGSSSNYHIKFSPQAWAIDDDVTITDNLAIEIPYGCLLTLTAAKTLTINGPLIAGGYQIFSGTGVAAFGDGAIAESNVRWWGALGDDTNDDTVEINAAIAASLSTTGGRLYFPDGVYKISAALTFLQYNGFVLQGQSQGGTFIKQYTSDTPIFKFTKENTHTFEISDFYFEYDTAQSSTETESVAIYFDFDTGTSAGAYNFQVRRCQFEKVYKGIALDVDAAGHTIWGASFSDLYYNTTCSGPIIDAYATASIGKPNISVKNIYIGADTIENAQPIMRFQGVTGLSIDNIEYNSIDNGATALVLQGGCNATIGNIRVSDATYTVTADNFLAISDSVVHIGTITFGDATQNMTGASEYFTLIKTAGDVFLDISVIEIASFTLTDGDAWILYGGAAATQSVKIGYIHDIGSFYLTNIESAAHGATVLVEDWNKPSISADNGDSALTIAVGDEQVQMFETELTADRTVTLPEHEVNGTNVFHGLTYKIVRTSGAGAFTLYVKDNDAATIGSIAVSKKGALTVMYRRTDWVLIGDEEW